jgi:cob(I)alamin adenosyltransferase
MRARQESSMKIYTKTGDGGETGLFGGARVSKSSLRVSTYGEVDELNSALGVVRLHSIDEERDALLARIQSELFDVGAELASKPGKELGIARISDADVELLERAIDRAEEHLPELRTFILPGGSPAASYLHVARTVCRRAERSLVELAGVEDVRPELVRYLNRLSDLLFVLARFANARAGVSDVPWEGRGRSTT